MSAAPVTAPDENVPPEADHAEIQRAASMIVKCGGVEEIDL
jgi:hypothetical protein